MKFELGEKLRDTVTGFEGIATARHQYLNGCVRYTIEAGKKEGGVEELWFDENRLALSVEPGIVPSKAGGGPEGQASRPRL